MRQPAGRRAAARGWIVGSLTIFGQGARTSGFGIIASVTACSSSWYDAMNARSVRAVGGEGVEVVAAQAIRLVRPDEVREVRRKLRDDRRIDRVIDPRPDLDVGRVEALLPADGIVMTTSPPISSLPVQVVADRRPEEPRPEAALPEDPRTRA